MTEKIDSTGRAFRRAVKNETPLQIAGSINAYAALLARDAGFQAIYLSGAGVANASYGLPDLGFTSLMDVAEEVKRITKVCNIPILVDIDTGWNSPEKTVSTMIDVGAAAVHLEDQVEMKRCGHRPGKQLISRSEMQDRIRSAVIGRTDPDFVIMARTDAHAVEGFDACIQRSLHYIESGADMIFAEAFASLEEYKIFTAEVEVPVLANITEFGKTPLFTADELAVAGIAIVLYPLSAFRAMSFAAINVYKTIRQAGTQQSMIDKMQTRDELYTILDYKKFENEADHQLKMRQNKHDKK